ncbi:MAG: anhydro-N-acetylmuramic acid kinase [Gammaproteobacteria bacterium]|nr:anhydro-N-acetylmuramic acid kinase [Gammaproteobacteria bacterium]
MGYFVGAISGTSIDGLDLALVEISTNSVDIKHDITVPFPDELRAHLLDLTLKPIQNVVQLSHAHAELGKFIGEQVAQFISNTGYSASDIVAVGSHGQTVSHSPEGELSYSYQIGDASRIAAISGVDTIADFRAADIAAGGQGAPLVPILHDRVFRSEQVNRTVVNIGGISNVTYLPMTSSNLIVGFDTGPGNTLLDTWTQNYFECSYDNNGDLASSGSIVKELLNHLLTDPWFEVAPPKSTGREHFNLEYIHDNIQSSGVNPNPEDTLATLTEFTATSLSTAIRKWCCNSGEVIVCGGGRLNKLLMDRIEHHLPDHVLQTSDMLGINGDAVEAVTFAFLAHLFVIGEAGNIPTVTGAKREKILGCLYRA